MGPRSAAHRSLRNAFARAGTGLRRHGVQIMVMRRWDPFGEMVTLRSAMDRLFEDAWIERPGASRTGSGMQMPLDVVEQGDNFTVKASLPGVKPEDVNITVLGDTLTI